MDYKFPETASSGMISSASANNQNQNQPKETQASTSRAHRDPAERISEEHHRDRDADQTKKPQRRRSKEPENLERDLV